MIHRMTLASPSRLALSVVIVVAAWLSLARAADPLDKEHAAKMAKGLALFKDQVRPVLVKRCLKCHGGQEEIEGGLDLTDREPLLRGGDTGPALIAGNAKDSLLFKLITHAKKPHMPSGAAKLPDDVIAQIAAWIDLGAPYDTPLVSKKHAPAWTTRTVPAEARQFWSFQPLKRVEPPAVKDVSVVHPVDRFLRARLEAAGLTPNAPVSKRQLIRRVYFDLLGLPPTSQEVESFVNDAAPDAFDKLIDKLLASPHYGERWARHWLDLARFAESHGFEHDYDRPNAYHYRDFVIRALNDDLPYHTFVKWQLAGDEYEPENPLALMATGYLAAGVHSTQITKKEVEKHRYDEMDDMLSTVGTSMLGLTFGCARCHDHKFDPILQRDYYRMLSTFTTTVRSDYDVNTDPAGFLQAKAAFDREHAPFEAALKKFETEQLPARFAAWEKTDAATTERYPWVILDIVGTKGEEGTTFAKQDDGSVLVTGKNPVYESYRFTTQTDLTGITAVRLEALAHPSLVKGGPGRAGNGNFALSDFRVTALAKAPGSKPEKPTLRNPRATFEQKGLPIAAAIDEDEKSAWAVDPEFGKDHAAVFEFATPVGAAGGTTLSFTLSFRNNAGHSIGRPRLSVTTQPGPVDLRGPAVPQSVVPLFQTPAEKRSAEQNAALLQWYRTLDSEWQKLRKAADEHLAKAPKPPIVKMLISSEGVPAVRLHTQGGDFLNETNFLRRGDPDQKEGVATPGFLQVLVNAPEQEKHWQTTPPQGWRTSYRRRALAEWMTDVEHGAGSLLARVIVNRLWQHHMGRGIVATPSDFGKRGEAPTHPELLDWLASELIRNGWRLKPIHKLIVTSSAYRQSGERDDAKLKVDMDNKLFWRRPARRLEAEVIRDALLAVSGELDAKMFGPGTLDAASKRRSIYFTVKRSKLVPMMQVFDAPEALGGVADRPTTTIAPQALLMMNNPQVRGWARSMAKRIAPDGKTSVEDAVKAGYLLALGRPPSAEEHADTTAFVRGQMESYQKDGKNDGRELALADLCQVLMCLNEFVYVD
jgi:hypothetical protein